MKKTKILLGKKPFFVLIIDVFFLGVMSSSLLRKKQQDNKLIKETEQMLLAYSNTDMSIDSIENIARLYNDTANIETILYVMKYNELTNEQLPDYYTTAFGDTIPYNKDMFFKYVALHYMSKNLLEARKYIINGLLITNDIAEEERIKEKGVE